MRIAIGIPARYASTRFPGKPLAKLAGRPMVAHVIERAKSARIGPVYVATDDKRIADVARKAGAIPLISRKHHASGSARLAEAMAEVDCDVVINVQGDEPLIEPSALQMVSQPILERGDLPMATLAHPIDRIHELHDPNIVKVVVNASGHAMYFSRAPIPYPRGKLCEALKHIGVYAYRKDFLMRFPTLPPCDLETSEQLEQLRVLYHGYPIAVVSVPFDCIGVDTPEDLAKAEALLTHRS